MKKRHYSSEEMGQLMEQLQEYLERKVLCLVLLDPFSGAVSLACPTGDKDSVVKLLRAFDWDEIARA